MAQQKKGLVARLLEGKERSEEYARSTLPTNRWQLFWDIFKGNFGKIVKVNLLMLIFFIPLLIVVIMYFMMLNSSGLVYPFGANLGVGYPAAPNQQGVAELLVLQNGLFLYIGIFVTSFIAALGFSGGLYVVRNMVWTEGIFVSNDFWRGIKLNYKNALQATLFFSVFFMFFNGVIGAIDFSVAIGGLDKAQTVFMNISKVMSYIFMALIVMMFFWMLALGVNYELKFLMLVRNAFIVTVATVFQTAFFIALAFIPYLLFLIQSTFFMLIGIFAVLLFAFAYTFLVWLDFAQWVFDKYINPRIEGAKVGRGIFNKDGSAASTGGESESALEYKRTILAYGKSRLVARPIKPIDDSLQVYDLPTSFTREDLKRLKASKQNIIEDTEAYAEEHKNDLRYVEYNKQFEEREKALQDELDAKGKKKKRKPPKMLGE